ncbi:MAG: NAD-dependent epimerase/dehydratase family protein [Clostridiaceae bacterium]|nr:NAD-dependent epimerase/dehydratase family protein [Clostridiaceae bacterium]
MWTEEKLDQILTTPSQALIDDMRSMTGDIMILGAGGKMGPTLALLAKRAVKAAGVDKKVIAVSRFTDPVAVKLLQDNSIDTISLDLMAEGALDQLPDTANIIYMAGRKFGTGGNECETWSMNASLPTLVSRRFKKANIVVFSTGNIYPMMPVYSGGATEDIRPAPIGEYGMSSLARERVFEFGARKYGSRVLIFRLNYAVDLRYGVLYDLADKIMRGEPIPLGTTCFNCIWQGYANEIAIRSLKLAGTPAAFLNVTGPETVAVRYAAEQLGKYLGKAPQFEGEASDKAFLSNASHCFEQFGYPDVSLNTLIQWQAEWLLDGGRTLNKPTHFEERKGNF